MGYQFKRSDITYVPDTHADQSNAATPTFIGKVAGHPYYEGRSITSTKLGKYQKIGPATGAVNTNYTAGVQKKPPVFTNNAVASAEANAIARGPVTSHYKPSADRIDFLTLSMRHSGTPILPICYYN